MTEPEKIIVTLEVPAWVLRDLKTDGGRFTVASLWCAGEVNTVADVWAAWNALPEGHSAPVKAIAQALELPTASVARIVYPPAKFGPWTDDQEPDQ
jgi:hypothetical protein